MLSPGFAADHIGKKAGVADMPGTSLPKPRIKFQFTSPHEMDFLTKWTFFKSEILGPAGHLNLN